MLVVMENTFSHTASNPIARIGTVNPFNAPGQTSFHIAFAVVSWIKSIAMVVNAIASGNQSIALRNWFRLRTFLTENAATKPATTLTMTTRYSNPSIAPPRRDAPTTSTRPTSTPKSSVPSIAVRASGTM
ncbi:MAG: hypothetical protein BWY06_02895 [Candidatus Latescibacteria bacterium ADurb.Bin168]|nr:MAG: hypothetical protein BWY06_02895 [Candidatus Latescibacteria bacterium ADurb.Bin168]